MNKKHGIVIIIQSVAILILVLVLFMRQNRNIDSVNTDFFKVTEGFLIDEIRNNETNIKTMEDMIKKTDKDFIEKADKIFNSSYQYIPFSHLRMLFSYYNDAITVLNLTKELEKEINQNIYINTKKIIDFSEDNFFYVHKELMSMIELLNNSQYGIWEKKYALLLIKNYYLQKCISQFDYSIPLSYGRVINYAERDTVNLGEIYQSQILFSAIDATGNITIFENGDTVRYGKFEEKATKKGHNNRKGYMEISHREGTMRYEVNIDYYVK